MSSVLWKQYLDFFITGKTNYGYGSGNYRKATKKDPNEIIAVSLWQLDDIKCVCEEDNIELSDEQCDKILNNLELRHDAKSGINWDVIRCHIDMLLNGSYW